VRDALAGLAPRFEGLAPGEKRSEIAYVKLEGEMAEGLLSAGAKVEFKVEVTRESDGTWTAERSQSAGFIVLVGVHHDESVKTTGAGSLEEALVQLDFAEAITLADRAGQNVSPDVLESTWTRRFGPEADLKHRETEENIDIGLYYAEGDTKFGGKVGGETARNRSTFTAPDGRKDLTTGLEYTSTAEASFEMDGVADLKANVEGKRMRDESNTTDTKVGMDANIAPMGLTFGFEEELSGEGRTRAKVTLDLVKMYGESSMLRFLRANSNERLPMTQALLQTIGGYVSSWGGQWIDPRTIASAIAQAEGLTSIKLEGDMDGNVTMTLLSDPGSLKIPDTDLKIGAGLKRESTFQPVDQLRGGLLEPRARPHPDRAIPAPGEELPAVGGEREAGDACRVPFESRERLRPVRPPDLGSAVHVCGGDQRLVRRDGDVEDGARDREVLRRTVRAQAPEPGFPSHQDIPGDRADRPGVGLSPHRGHDPLPRVQPEDLPHPGERDGESPLLLQVHDLLRAQHASGTAVGPPQELRIVGREQDPLGEPQDARSDAAAELGEDGARRDIEDPLTLSPRCRHRHRAPVGAPRHVLGDIGLPAPGLHRPQPGQRNEGQGPVSRRHRKTLPLG
jgi:hypothetical protein